MFMRLMFSISAQAMLLSGNREALRLTEGEYSTTLLFFPTPLWSLVNCTFIITAPSFRCRLTFLPRNDLALLELKFSIFYQSPSWSAILLQHCWHIGRVSPFNWIYSLMFSLLQVSFQGFLQCSILGSSTNPFAVFAFKAVAVTTVWCWGGVSESKT